jgi:hypothetical protein
MAEVHRILNKQPLAVLQHLWQTFHPNTSTPTTTTQDKKKEFILYLTTQQPAIATKMAKSLSESKQLQSILPVLRAKVRALDEEKAVLQSQIDELDVIGPYKELEIQSLQQIVQFIRTDMLRLETTTSKTGTGVHK